MCDLNSNTAADMMAKSETQRKLRIYRTKPKGRAKYIGRNTNIYCTVINGNVHFMICYGYWCRIEVYIYIRLIYGKSECLLYFVQV